MKKEALLYEKLGKDKVHCFLCAHNCRIEDGKFGFCGVRKNEGGVLYSYIYGELIASNIDPIEKKPLYHFLPGTLSYSIAAIGCNFHCGFCQNWQISQASAKDGASGGVKMNPERVVKEAEKHSCKSIAYTYTEPTIFFEYAYDTAKLAKEAGLYNVFVTNGYMTEEAIGMIAPYLDAANVDLKSFNNDFYTRICKGRLEPVLNSIRFMKKNNIWVEITTLIIPGENDSDEELSQIAEFIAGIDKDIPWHISRFHPDYKFLNTGATPLETLRKAEGIAKKAGLRYVYLGNVSEDTNTYCHKCGELLIKRTGFSVIENRIEKGACPSCGAVIKGLF